MGGAWRRSRGWPSSHRTRRQGAGCDAGAAGRVGSPAVLQHVATGATNRTVAERLWVTDQTVKFHLGNVYRKLGVSNRFEPSETGPLAVFDGPARAIHCACAISRQAQALGLDLQLGLHTGEVQLQDDRVRGVAVDVGARVAAEARPGEVLVSHTVKDLVAGSGIEFDERDRGPLEAVPGDWKLLAVRLPASPG